MAILGWRGHLALLAVTLALAAAPWFVPTFYLQLGSAGFVAAMLAQSLQLLVGGTGLVSLGHAGFFGLAAYTVHLATAWTGGLSIGLTLPLAIVVAGIAALAIGAMSLRTKGFFFLMVTLAFGQMLYFVFHDTGIGGGPDGAFAARPSLSVFGLEWVVSRRDRPSVLYWLNLGTLVVVYLATLGLMRSLFGRVLLGIKANESRMVSLGYDTGRYKLAAFVAAGALAGVAGHAWTMTEAFVNPELLGWHRSAEALLVILLGGLGSLHGPLVGALAYTALGEVAQLVTERQRLVEGLVILVVVLALPRGLAGLRLPAVRATEAAPVHKTAVP